MNAPVRLIRPGRDRPTQPRLLRELATIEAMAQIYCADHHGGSKPCEDCQALIDYAAKRLAVCTFGDDKPVCAKCQIHCYGRAMRERVRDVMRYAGPRMIWRHPWLALMHVLDKRYKAPPKPGAVAQPPSLRLPAGTGAGTDARPDSGRRPGLSLDNAGGNDAAASRSG
jgi:Nitrous oxide-stimulated promoter